MSAVEVLAVPSAPTISTAFRCLCSIRSRNRARVESIVGTRRFEKSSTSVLGYSQRGGRHLEGTAHNWVRGSIEIVTHSLQRDDFRPFFSISQLSEVGFVFLQLFIKTKRGVLQGEMYIWVRKRRVWYVRNATLGVQGTKIAERTVKIVGVCRDG